MSDQTIVELLQEAYVSEIETVMNYISNGVSLHGIRAEQVGQSLLQDVQEEVNHAQLLAERLNTLGEVPKGSFEGTMTQESLQPPTERNDIESVIQGVLDAESDAIDLYREIISVASEEEDYVTEDLAVQLLTDEEAHHSEFRDFAEEYDMNV